VSTIQEDSYDVADSAKHPWRDAAINAEFDSGEHETTEAAARSHVIVRLARMALGSAILLLGVVAMVGPGPGILIVAVGLAILARDVAWADRLLQRVRRRMPTDSDGRVPRSSIITMSVVTLATVLASVWWFVR